MTINDTSVQEENVHYMWAQEWKKKSLDNINKFLFISNLDLYWNKLANLQYANQSINHKIKPEQQINY